MRTSGGFPSVQRFFALAKRERRRSASGVSSDDWSGGAEAGISVSECAGRVAVRHERRLVRSR